MLGSKRKLDDPDGPTKAFAEQKEQAKVLKLGEEPAERIEGGVNYIEIDGKSCTHEVVWPRGVDGCKDAPGKSPVPPPLEFPFKLDPFQQTAINCLELGDSVLVSAHTSAGKTVVAQYACAMAIRDKTRIIYTSPLKALSNQKYRELYEQFEDVGLLTGDSTINPDATCLVVTTEVLRCMLYQMDDIVREIKCVVFDEIHYLRDKDRGVVWEECLILLPKQARCIFLSATVPNAREFALWFSTVHEAQCHVVYTEYRPVPLQHYLFPMGADGLYMVIDERNIFRDDNFQKAMSEVTGESVAKQLKLKKDINNREQDDADIFKLVKMILQRNYDPVIVFAFSKKDCEALALQLSQIDVNENQEKKLVEGIFSSAVECLSEKDRQLPQVTQMLPMLKRGIGVHHSGLLPIVKEVIEILFQEGLLKVLFATETFSTGLNMPAKTVVFAGARKFDGGKFRFLYSGEYIQMSGRAGRRGLDDRGIVILMTDKSMDTAVCRDLLRGGALPLLSEFRLSYNMIINMMRLEDKKPSDIIKLSFRQFLCERSIPKLQEKAKELKEQIDSIQIEDEEKVAKYLKWKKQRKDLKAVARSMLAKPKYCLPFLQPGRLVRLVQPEPETGEHQAGAGAQDEELEEEEIWAGVVNFQKVKKTEQGVKDASDRVVDVDCEYLVDVLVKCKPSEANTGTKMVAAGGIEGDPEVIGVPLQYIDGLSKVRMYMPKDLRPSKARKTAMQSIGEAVKRLQSSSGDVPLLDPESDMKVSDSKFRKLRRKLDHIETLLADEDLVNQGEFGENVKRFKARRELQESLEGVNKELEAAGSMIFKSELKARQRVLRRMGFVDSDGVVLKKGQVALGFNSSDELVLTDMLFNGDFSNLEPNQIAAACACFIWKEGSEKKDLKLPSEVVDILRVVRGSAQRVGQVCAQCKAIDSEEAFLAKFRPELMEAVMAWSKGGAFTDVIKMVDVYEGSLVRAMRQLCQVISDLEVAVSVMGESTLLDQVRKARETIQRDVMFAASLYL
ncbi:hypothetical protein BSKO_00136 [Bryopsis sp. KO-2023]|nr:hypothetical protein BSKO_00136 [Bryopsis sp. KO-2023]